MVVNILIIIDTISLLFISTVCLISGCVFIYSSRYIIGDNFRNRFCLLVLLFIFSIALLIFRPRLIRLLLGWDGLGVSSYLLVCYYRSEKRFNARILTAITNRVGDVLILILISMNIGAGMTEFTLVGFRTYTYH